MARLDKNDVLPTADIVSIIGKRVALKRKGKELSGLCPFHADKNPSFTVSTKGFYKCFGCGEGGDVVDFIMKTENVDFPTALNIIAEDSTGSPLIYNAPPPAPRAPIDPQVIPVPPNAPPAVFVHSRYGQPEKVWTYSGENGEILGHVVRFIDEKGKKQILPYTYRQNKGWAWVGFDFPRPLYGLDFIAKHKDRTHIVVEGEKTAEYLQSLLSNSVVVTWSGGFDSAHKTDWSPLTGVKNVVLWPDNDHSHRYGKSHVKPNEVKPWNEQPGNSAMLKIAEIIRPFVGSIHWIKNQPDKPCGWDGADENWNEDDLVRFLTANRTEVPTVEPEIAPLPATNTHANDMPFRSLGFRKEGDSPRYCFFAGSSKTVVILSSASMSKQSMLNLAPLNWWETWYPAPKGSKNTFNVDAASEFLMSSCIERGIFSDARIRGRGSWIDDKRTVLHSGDRLIVDGCEMPLNAIKSRYVYEQGEPLEFSVDHPLETIISAKLVDMLKIISWTRNVNAHLLAGWCVIAPVCGALKWRPHIWITGPAGTGKSWILKEIIRVLLGETALAVQADTTAPGLRAYLGNDALPVVFDEAEGEHQGAQDRIRSAIELMRAASSDDGGVIAKGSAGGGKASTTKIRSMFCFSSIVPQASQQADKRRITSLDLKKELSKDNREKSFERLVNMHADLINDDFIRGLHARTIKLLPVIVKNSDVFNKAIAAVLGEKSYGDQLGPMLAGAYSLISEELVSFQAAKDWISTHDWSEESSLDSNRDEFRLFSHIMEQIVDVDGEHTKFKRSIGELCQISRTVSDVVQFPAFNDITPQRADMALRRCGIKVEHGKIVISNQHDGIKRLLARTPWGGGNHSKLLIRIDGSERIASTTFSAGAVKSNAIAVPIQMID
jgi:putative DNA primase/helicase